MDTAQQSNDPGLRTPEKVTLAIPKISISFKLVSLKVNINHINMNVTFKHELPRGVWGHAPRKF